MVGRRWGCAHEEVGRIAVSEDLGELLEVELVVLPDVDEGEDVLKLLVLGKRFGGLRVEFLHHLEEFFEGEVAASWVVPLPVGVFGGNHVVVEEIADVLELGLKAGSDLLLVLLDVQHLDELLPVYEGFGLELAVVQQQVDLFGSQSDVQGSEGLLKHEVGDFTAFLLVDLGEDLL